MTAYEATRIGVLLANTGTPKSPEPRDVRRYLGRFLMDERIRPMAKAPWWLILHLFILPTRSVKSGRKYGKIWTEAGSPFDVEHAKLRNLLEQRLQGDGMDVRVQVGQSYGDDSIEMCIRDRPCSACWHACHTKRPCPPDADSVSTVSSLRCGYSSRNCCARSSVAS